MDSASPHQGWTAGLAGSTQVAIVGGLIVVIVVLALVLTPGSSGGVTAGGYPAIAQTSFLSSCEAGQSVRVARCTCAWSYIEAHVSYSDFVAGNQAVISGGTTPSWLGQAIAACR